MFLLFHAKLGVYREAVVSSTPVGTGCFLVKNRRPVERIHVTKRWTDSTFLRCYETQIARCDLPYLHIVDSGRNLFLCEGIGAPMRTLGLLAAEAMIPCCSPGSCSV